MQRKLFNGPELALLRLAMLEHAELVRNYPGQFEEAVELLDKLMPSSNDAVDDNGIVYRMHRLEKLRFNTAAALQKRRL